MVGETVLVTGGCGFIGQRLVAALKVFGHSVRVLDIQRSDFSGVEALGAKVVKGSVTDGEALKKAVGNSVIVFHLASPDLAIQDPSFIGKQIAGGAEMLMEDKVPGTGDAELLRRSYAKVRQLKQMLPELIIVPSHDAAASEAFKSGLANVRAVHS